MASSIARPVTTDALPTFLPPPPRPAHGRQGPPPQYRLKMQPSAALAPYVSPCHCLAISMAPKVGGALLTVSHIPPVRSAFRPHAFTQLGAGCRGGHRCISRAAPLAVATARSAFC